MPPKISIIMPVYNGASFIGDSIHSVLAQTHQDWELIIIDDGSTDGSRKIVESFKDARIQYDYQENAGVSAARNKAIRLSQGKWLAFIDADDVWLPEKLSAQLPFCSSSDLVFSDCYFIKEGTQTTELFSASSSIPANRDPGLSYLLSHNNFIPLLTVIAKKESVVAAGMFDHGIKHGEDFDLWLRMKAQGAQFAYIGRPLGAYRVHPSSASSDYGKMIYGDYALLKKYISLDLPMKEVARSRSKIILKHYLTYMRIATLPFGDRIKLLIKSVDASYAPKFVLSQILFTIFPRLTLHKTRKTTTHELRKVK